MEKIMYLYALDMMADWEPGYIIAELNSGRFCKPGVSYELVICGRNQDPITTMGGISLHPEICIEDIKPVSGNILILPGSDTWLDSIHSKSLNCVAGLLKTDLVIAAICGATMGLASIGLLNSRFHTSNDIEVLKMFCPDYTGESCYLDRPAVTDGNLITASGLAPVDFAHHVFKILDVMHESTLSAWYNLNLSKNPKYYYELIHSIENKGNFEDKGSQING